MNDAKKYDHLIGLTGFSEQLLRNHFTLYEGYVANVNKYAGLSEQVEMGSVQFAELKRRFGWEYNGMKLHELYFENLTLNFTELLESSQLREKIIERFGSFDAWEKDFRATGAMRGIGWVIFYYDQESGSMFNVWVNEHDMGHLAGAKPLLIMDVFEHAYMIDYNLKKVDYIDNFFKAINWQVVEKRFK